MKMAWGGETADRDGMLHVPTYLAQSLTPTSTPCKGLGGQHGHALLAWTEQQSNTYIGAVHAA
jgi:hypothetical protein